MKRRRYAAIEATGRLRLPCDGNGELRIEVSSEGQVRQKVDLYFSQHIRTSFVGLRTILDSFLSSFF